MYERNANNSFKGLKFGQDEQVDLDSWSMSQGISSSYKKDLQLIFDSEQVSELHLNLDLRFIPKTPRL